MNMIQCPCPISRCLNGKDRRWPIQLPRDTKLFPVALLVSVGVFLLVVVYAHTRHGHVLYLLATNAMPLFFSLSFPFSPSNDTFARLNEFQSFRRVCLKKFANRRAIERAKFLHSATPRPYPWHTSFHRALPRCFRSYF